jgi:uncharacterized protein YciI
VEVDVARFAVEYSYGGDRERRMAARPAHRDYLSSLAERGKLLAAGPFADDSGGLLVFEVADEAELTALLDADPYVPTETIVQKRVREWTTVLGVWV